MKSLSNYLICEAKAKYFYDMDWPSSTQAACFNNKTLKEVKDSVREVLSSTELSQYSYCNGILNMVESGLWDENIVKDTLKDRFNANGDTLEQILMNGLKCDDINRIDANFIISFTKKPDIKTVKKPLDKLNISFKLYSPEKNIKTQDIKKILKKYLGVTAQVEVDFEDASNVGSSFFGDLKRACEKNGAKYIPIYEYDIDIEVPIQTFNKMFNI